MDTNIPFCVCGLLEEETTEHFLLRCTLFFNERKILLDKVKKIFPSLSNLAKTQVVSTLDTLDMALDMATIWHLIWQRYGNDMATKILMILTMQKL